MSTNTSHLADNIKPVTRGTILHVDVSAGVAIDLMLAANRPAVPPGSENDPAKDFWFGEYVSIQADGGDLYFFFADSPAPLPIGGPVAGIGGRQSVRVLDGQTVDQLLPFNPPLQSTGGSAPPPLAPPRRYLCAIKSAASVGPVFLYLWPSSSKAM